MKKVLFTATVDSHILQFHIPYLKYFKEQGYEVHVATNGNEKIPFCDVKHKIHFERSPFKINNLKAIKQLRKIIEQEKFEIIHCHTPVGSVTTRIAAKKARRKYNTKVIYTAHGFHFFKGAPIINWVLFYPIEKWLSKYTDCLITINQEDYKLASDKFHAKRTELVHGVGVDPEKFNTILTESEKEKTRKELGIKKDDYVITVIGELNKNKNQIMAIEAIRNIQPEDSNIKLLLVGKGELEHFYKEKVKEYNIENNVIFAGYRKDVNKLLQISNLQLSLSKREGLPVNVIEGMLCNIPIIVTNCRGNRDLVKENMNGYVINNLEQLIDKIKKAYAGEFNYKPIDIKYLYERNIIKRMAQIYSSVSEKNVTILRSTSIKNDSRVIKEAKALSKSKYNVKILGWDRDGFFKNNSNEIKENEKIIKIRVFKRTARYASGIKNIFKLLSFQIWLTAMLYKDRENIDIIHSCDFDTALPAKLISKLYNKKLVYDIFDYYIDSHYVPDKLKKIIEKKEISVINYADLTIICSEWRKEQIIKSKPKRLLVIHNTPDISNIKTDKCVNSKFKIAYVGILQEGRLLKEIATKIKEMKDVELHIGGFGIYAEYFQKLAKENDNIFFYGTMEYNDVLKLESKCDILFATYDPSIANHKYSSPNKLYEAMALGKPIIVCNNTGIDSIVKNEQIGYSINYNAQEFKECINKLKENKKINEQFGLNAKKTYNKYSWQQMEKRLTDAYKLL